MAPKGPGSDITYWQLCFFNGSYGFSLALMINVGFSLAIMGFRRQLWVFIDNYGFLMCSQW